MIENETLQSFMVRLFLGFQRVHELFQIILDIILTYEDFLPLSN